MVARLLSPPGHVTRANTLPKASRKSPPLAGAIASVSPLLSTCTGVMSGKVTMSPLDRQSTAFRSSLVDSHRDHATRSRRPDFNELAADEHRRALRSPLQAKGEHPVRWASRRA
jgi:hypothetical protein